MVDRSHNCGEMIRCKVVQNHVFYNAQETSLPPIRIARTPKWWACVQWENWLDSCQQLMYWIWLSLHFFPTRRLVWFGTAIWWGYDAGDPRVSSLMEAMLSTDIIFTNTCCDAKKLKCERAIPTYWLHTWDNGIVFWQRKPPVVTSAFQPVPIIVASA